MARRIASHYALINGSLERNIIVDVDSDGVITAVGRYENIDREAHVEFFPGILIPGMINTHCHLELSYLRGAIAEGGGYATFASEIGRVRGNFTTEERLRAAAVADAMMWEQGIEAVADIANDDLVMDIKERSRIEYKTMFEFFGLNNHDTTPLETLASKYQNASVTPHSTYSVQEQEFNHICQKYSPLLSLHFLESENEALLYEHKGSLAEWYSRMGWVCEFLHHTSPAQRIANTITNGSRLLLVHATCATKRDVEIIEQTLDTAQQAASTATNAAVMAQASSKNAQDAQAAAELAQSNAAISANKAENFGGLARSAASAANESAQQAAASAAAAAETAKSVIHFPTHTHIKGAGVKLIQLLLSPTNTSRGKE